MESLVYPRERTLGAITLALGVIIWLLILVGTVGIVLAYLLMGFVIYLFAQSALIAHVRHTGVQLSAQQMPDLHDRFVACCEKLHIDTPPEAYVLQGNALQALNRAKEAVLAYLHVDILFPREAGYHAESLYHMTKLWKAVQLPERGLEAEAKLQSSYPNSEWTKKLSTVAN